MSTVFLCSLFSCSVVHAWHLLAPVLHYFWETWDDHCMNKHRNTLSLQHAVCRLSHLLCFVQTTCPHPCAALLARAHHGYDNAGKGCVYSFKAEDTTVYRCTCGGPCMLSKAIPLGLSVWYR